MELMQQDNITELGTFPFEWISKELKEISSFITKGTTPTTLGFKWVMDGVLFLRSECVSASGLDLTQSMYISEDANDSLYRSKIEPHDILITITGNVGRVVYLEESFEGGNINQHIAKIRIINKEFDKRYVYYFLYQIKYRKYFESIVTGQAYPQISLKQVREAKIYFPPDKQEQTAIATALSDTDALIENLEKLIEKKRNIKQGVISELFCPKKDWKSYRIKDLIINFQNGYGFSTKGYKNNGIPIVTMAHIGLDGSFQYNETNMNFWDYSELESLKSFHLNNNDVIIAMTDVTPNKNLIGRMTIVKTNKTLLLNQRVGLLRIDKCKINALFLSTFSNMRKWRDYCIASASLGVQANLSTKDIINGEIEVPQIEEQLRIATIVNDFDIEINRLEGLLNKYRMIKQGMMQVLLTGKIRLL